jgi:hypothetical protein
MAGLSTTALLGVAGLLINGLGLGFVAIQVVLARRQLQHAQNVNQTEVTRGKRQSTIDFYMTTVEIRTKWKAVLPDDWETAAIHEFIEAAYASNDKAMLGCIVDYLGYFEALAVAIASEVYDLQILDSIAGTRIRSIARNYKPYFERARVVNGVPSLYVELEWLGERLEALRSAAPTYVLFAHRELNP